MKNRLLLIPVLFISLFTLSAKTYQITVDSIVYSPLGNSISLNNGLSWDNELYTISLDFEFGFFGDAFSTLYVDSNGGLYDQDINNATQYSVLYPYLADLADRGGDYESLSNISYVVQGGEGDQILKLEWDNAGFYDDYYGEKQSFVNFQVWFYERDRSIEIYYGDTFIFDDEVLYGYGGGPLVALIHNFNENSGLAEEFFIMTGDANNPTGTLLKGDVNSYEYFNFLQNSPAPNTRYRFSRMDDVSTNEIPVRSSQFSVYPNPATSVLSLVKNGEAGEIQSISIYNNDGRLMKTVATDYSNIDIADLVSGVYHLNILTEDGLAVKRFVKLDI